MRRYAIGLIISFLFLVRAFAADKAADPNQFFYKANAFYEKGDYAKAIEGYIHILDMGLENGEIYYNAGNGFLKLGKIGYAILCYEKARRFIPGDSDLKSNLSYAKGLVEEGGIEATPKNFILRMIERPFKDYNLNTIAIFTAFLYIIVIVISSVFIAKPIFARKAFLLLLAALAVFLLSGGELAIRYYDEEILKHGIVIQHQAECRYEPIDKSTTYYKLNEGSDVLMLETRNGWLKIKRYDGKGAWVKKEAVEEI